MCIIDSCFKTPDASAPPSTKISHYTNRALCSFAIALISLAALIYTAYNVFPPLMMSEYVTLTIYAVVTIVALAKTAIDMVHAWNVKSIRPQAVS